MPASGMLELDMHQIHLSRGTVGRPQWSRTEEGTPEERRIHAVRRSDDCDGLAVHEGAKSSVHCSQTACT